MALDLTITRSLTGELRLTLRGHGDATVASADLPEPGDTTHAQLGDVDAALTRPPVDVDGLLVSMTVDGTAHTGSVAGRQLRWLESGDRLELHLDPDGEARTVI